MLYMDVRVVGINTEYKLHPEPDQSDPWRFILYFPSYLSLSLSFPRSSFRFCRRRRARRRSVLASPTMSTRVRSCITLGAPFALTDRTLLAG